MNKIYKVIWSKVKHQYVVVSELAHSNGKQSRTSRNSIRSRIAALVVCGAIAAFGVFNALPNSAYAADSDYIAFVTTEKGQNANENQGDTIQINGYKYTSTRIAKPDNSYTWYWVRDGYNIQLERLERPGSDGSKDYVVRAFKDGGGEVETSLVHSYQNKIEDTGVTTLNGKNLHSYEAGVYAGGSNGYTAVRMEDKWSEADQTFKPNNDPMIFDGKEWRQAERTDFKDVKFNEETGNYEYNGQIVATENLYVVDFVKTKGNDTEVEGTKLGCFVVDGKVYTGTVHGKNNEILMTGINEDNKYVTYWASEYTDEKATMAQMPISQYKETISGLASDINAIHQDDIKEIQINQIDNGGSINLQTNGEFVPARDEKGDIITDETGKPVYVAQGGKNIPGGITIRNTTNSGSEGNDVAVEISNDKNSFTVDAGSKVVGKITTKNGVEEAGVGDANKTLTGLKINGVDYALSQGKTYSNGNGISIDEENNKISVNAGDGLTFGTEQTNDEGKLKVNVGDGLSIKDGQVINNLKVTADTNATKNNKNGGNWTVTDSKANITLTNTTLDEADSNSYNSDENNLIKDDSNANNNTKYGRNYKVFDTDGNEVALNDVASADTLKTIDTTKIGDLKYNDFTEGDSDTTSIVKNDDNLTTAVGKLDNAVNETKTLAGKHTKMTVNDGTLATTDGEYNSDGNLQLKQTVENDQTTYDVKLNDNITLGKDTPSQININGNPSEGEAALSIGNKFIVGQDGSIQSTVKTGTVTEKVSTFNFDKDGVNIKSAVNGKETSTLINGGTVTIKDSNTDYTLIKGEKITAGDIKLNAQENKSTILGLTNTEWNDTVKENVKNNASEATVAATQGQLLDATKLAVQYDNSDKDSVILGGSKNYIEGTAEDKGGVELTNVAYATGADKSQAVNVEYLEDKTGNLQYNAGSETDNDEISIVQNGEDLTTAVGKLDNAVNEAKTEAGKHTKMTVNDGISAPELEEGQTEGTYSKDGNLQLKQKVNNGQTTYDIKLNPDVNLKGEGKNSDNRVWLSGSNGTITATTEKNLPKKTTVINGGNVYVGSSVSVGANDDVVITDKDITGLSNTTWDETLADKVENDNVLKGTAATQGQLLDVQEAVDTATTLAGKHTIVTVNDGISAPELEEGQTEGTYSKDGNLQLKQKVNDGQTTYDIKLNSVVTLDGDEPDNNNVVLDGNKGTISVTNKYVDTDTRPVKTITNTFNFNDEGATFTNTTKNGKGNGNGKAVTSFTNIDGGIITVSSDARKDKKDIVIDGDTGEITGLSNTTWTGTTETPNRAATEGQLQSAYDGSVKYWKKQDGTYDKSFIQLEGGEKGTTITHLKDGVVAEHSTEAINGSQLWETQQQIKDVETTANKHTIVSTTDDSNLTVKNVAKEGEADNYQVTLNDEVVLGDYFDKDNGVLISGNSGTISATNSITVGEDQGLVIDGQKKTIQGLSNTTWTGTTETPNRAATEGQLQNAYDGSVKYWRNEDGTYDKSFIQLEGGEEGTTITHLKDGVVAEYSTEAINGSQLWETQQQIKDVETTANKHTIVSTTKDSNLTVKNVAGEGEADNYQVALKDDITLKGDSSSIELTGTKGTIQVNQETAEGTNFTNINGNVVSIGYTNSEGIENAIVIDGGKGTITGLSNTTWDGKTDNASRVATEGQLKAVSDTVNAGWIATDNSGKEVAVNPDNNKLKFAGDDNITVSATTDENNNNAINVKLNDNITLGNGQSAITLNGSPENSNDPALSVGTDKFVVDQDGSLSVSDKFNVDAETGNVNAINNSGSAIMMNDDSVALNAGGNGIAISDEGILLNTNGINEDIKLVTKGTSVSVDSNGTTFTNTNTNETTNINGGTINVGDKLMVEEDGSIYATNNNGSTVMINDDGIALNSEGNGVVVSDDGITLNANGSAVTVDRFNGTTFTNTNTGETTSINGGTITTDTVKGLSNTTWNDELATQVAKSEELQGTAATQGQLQQAVSAVATEAAKQHTTVSGDDNLTVKSSVNENGGTNYQVTLDDDITLGNPKAGNTEGERSFTINTTDPEGYVPESYKTGSGADFIEENGGFMLFATDTQGFGVFGVTAKGSAWARDFKTYTTDIYGNNTQYSLNEVGDAVAQMSSYYNGKNSYTVFSRYLNEAEKDNPFVTVDEDGNTIDATRDIPLALRDDGAVLIGATIKGEDFTDNGIRINAETKTTYDKNGNEVTNNIATITGLENTEWKPPTPVATLAANDGSATVTSRAATESQLNDLYSAVAAYDVNVDGTIDYSHIALAGTPYGASRSGNGTHTGGTSITNVAYASGKDGSEAVNVDYLNDAISDAAENGSISTSDQHLVANTETGSNGVYKPNDDGNVNLIVSDEKGNSSTITIGDVASKEDLDNLKDDVGDLDYSKVEGDTIIDGDSVTDAIGKLDNKIDNITGTATDADNNTVTGGKINSDGTISLTQKDKDSIKLEGQLTDSGVVQEGTSFDKETGTITITSQDKYSGETSSVKVEGIASTEVVGATNKEDLATAYKDADKDGNATTEYITDSESMVEADVALDHAIQDVAGTSYANDMVLSNRIDSVEKRLGNVEERIDKVGAMAAAIANLRTMGFDPEAPTEIAIGVGQYKSETGIAIGVFHYPNQDFMLSASLSSSGDELMGGIGATWKLGRKSAAERAKDEEARHLEQAEEMKKLVQQEKVKAQAQRHAKLLAERQQASQKNA